MKITTIIFLITNLGVFSNEKKIDLNRNIENPEKTETYKELNSLLKQNLKIKNSLDLEQKKKLIEDMGKLK